MGRKRIRIFIRTADSDGNTPMALACSWGHLKITRWLFKVGSQADIHTPNDDGDCPMATLLMNGCMDMVHRMIPECPLSTNKSNLSINMHLSGDEISRHFASLMADDSGSVCSKSWVTWLALITRLITAVTPAVKTVTASAYTF